MSIDSLKQGLLFAVTVGPLLAFVTPVGASPAGGRPVVLTVYSDYV